MTSEADTVVLSGGGELQFIVDDGAPHDAELLVYHHGTPVAGPLSDAMVGAARGCGLRLVEVVRPGYGGSSRRPGRTVADVAPLVSTVADTLGHARFASFGWSGGGPHVLATAALLPERCVGVVSFAGVAPVDAAGLNWLAGMGEDNWHEFGAALAGDWFIEHFLTEAVAELVDVQGLGVIEAMASLLPEADRRALSAGAAEHMAAELRWSVAHGPWGWMDDDLAFVAPWGFDPAAITVPVHVWQGTDDLMVPFAHGQWLAANLPTARPHLLPGEGHLSLEAHLPSAFSALRDCF